MLYFNVKLFRPNVKSTKWTESRKHWCNFNKVKMRQRSGDTCQVNMYTTIVLHTLTSLGQDVNESYQILSHSLVVHCLAFVVNSAYFDLLLWNHLKLVHYNQSLQEWCLKGLHQKHFILFWLVSKLWKWGQGQVIHAQLTYTFYDQCVDQIEWV
jgi:hypothetical protein